MSRAAEIQAREDRRAFLGFLTALLTFAGSVFTAAGAWLTFTARERSVTRIVGARGTASGRATVAGVGESITGNITARLEPLRLSASGTVTNPPARTT